MRLLSGGAAGGLLSLWGTSHVIIAPHIAGETQCPESNAIDLLLENLERLSHGEAARNQVVWVLLNALRAGILRVATGLNASWGASVGCCGAPASPGPMLAWMTSGTKPRRSPVDCHSASGSTAVRLLGQV